MIRIIEKTGAALRAFKLAAGGNTVVLFALTVVPLVFAVGAAVDYTRANSIKAALQAAADATALALSKNAANLSNANLRDQATQYFLSVFHRPEAKSVKVSAKYSPGKGTLLIDAVARMKTDFLVVMGIPRLKIDASSTAIWGALKLQIALVLDNTGSMADDGKIDALKTASHQFLQNMRNAARTPGDIQVAIIPFANAVNVGKQNVNASWLDWQYYRDGATNDRSNWQGCVLDRDQDYDIQNTTPTPGNKSTLFPANYSTRCPAALVPLTSNWTTLNNKIDSMIATGTTNQTIGLAWGWQALTKGDPLDAPPPKGAQKILILMTDGMNTENRWSSNQAEIDARTQKICTNVKAAGITVYTVLVMAGNSSILQTCASDASKYFALTTSGEMVTTFQKIADNLSRLRLSK